VQQVAGSSGVVKCGRLDACGCGAVGAVALVAQQGGISGVIQDLSPYTPLREISMSETLINQGNLGHANFFTTHP